MYGTVYQIMSFLLKALTPYHLDKSWSDHKVLYDYKADLNGIRKP